MTRRMLEEEDGERSIDSDEPNNPSREKKRFFSSSFQFNFHFLSPLSFFQISFSFSGYTSQYTLIYKYTLSSSFSFFFLHHLDLILLFAGFLFFLLLIQGLNCDMTSENFASIEPWNFRTTFADSWISDAFSRDTETLTKALQQSMSNNSDTLTSDTISPFYSLVKPESVPTPTVSSVSGGSDPETAPKRRNTMQPTGGKITKRKSRASKRCQTTFIMVDPANFRQMVQQVTGVRFDNSELPMTQAVLKPEPHRPGNRLQQQGCLPTLDTSAFLLDHHLQQQFMGPGSSTNSGQGHASFSQPGVMVGDGGAGLDFDAFPSFPTLESWKVM